MEAYELVELYDGLWEETPKDTPVTQKVKSRDTCRIFLEVNELRVVVTLTVGPRGGLAEAILVFDPSEAIITDQLVVKRFSDIEGKFFALEELRRRVRQVSTQRREQALFLCEQAMHDFANRITIHPLDPMQLRAIESTSESLIAGVMQGGAPSLGRNGGGVPGHH